MALHCKQTKVVYRRLETDQITWQTNLDCVEYGGKYKTGEADYNPSKCQFDAELVPNNERHAVATDDEYDADCEHQSMTGRRQPAATHFTASDPRRRSYIAT